MFVNPNNQKIFANTENIETVIFLRDKNALAIVQGGK